MILKGLKKERKTQSWMLPVFLIGTLFLLLCFKFFSSSNPFKGSATNFDKEKYTCSAEKVEGDFFIENDVKFGGAKTQSKQLARTGAFSSKLDSTNKYGISLKLSNLEAGRTYKAQVWKRSHANDQGYLVVSAENSDDFYLSTNKSVEQNQDWWNRMELYFSVPDNPKAQTLNIYVFKSGSDVVEVYFDDFSVEAIQPIDQLSPDGFQAEPFHIQIDKQGEAKLEQLKKDALQAGILQTTDDSWIKSKVTTTNGIKKAKVRLKGDWLDHLMNGQPSFRVQLKSEDSWRGMQVFSVQSPKTRSFLNEWVYHQFLEYADVLTPRYDFVDFHFNGQPSRVYAYEEHFTKNLVENKLRREGPIIKFTEDRLWDGVGRALKNSKRIPSRENYPNAYWSSEIKPFKENKTKKNPTLKKSFEIAQNLLYQYQYGLKPASEVFDVELMGKFLAIVEILQAEHSLTWHNQRFYFNPVTNLLEPIGFDGFGTEAHHDPFTPLYMEKVYKQKHEFIEPLYRLFYDAKFVEAYVKYLNEYSQPEFIKKYFAQMDNALSQREQFLKRDFKDYTFNREHIVQRTIKIQEWLVPFSNSLQVFKKTDGEKKMSLEVKNTHVLPLEIVHIGKSKLPTNRSQLRSDWIYPNNLGDLPTYDKIEAPTTATTIHYRLAGLDSIFQTKIPVWSSPKDWTPRQELEAVIQKTKQQKWYKEENDVVIFDRKTYEFAEPVVIDEGKKVIIPSGTNFKFSKNAFFLSYSSVELRGEKEQPIIIEGLDDFSGTFIVMQSKQKSLAHHVIFRRQNTLKFKGWTLTGAVTFYESDVEIVGCRFINNLCEDALNIVRSKFEVKDCAFQGIFGDAFDADFCNGTVIGCGFKDIGNDALDFSTSTIDIDNCKMIDVGDKAISAGEHATISASNVEVERANIGFASKDLSVLTLDNVTVNNSSRGFTAYQKKPEYGPATINLKRHTINKVKFPFMIEPKSKLNK